MTTLILASASPRRQELLAQTGLLFSVSKPNIVEQRRPGETPVAYTLRNAREKAAAIAQRSSTEAIIIAADTIVVLGDAILEKPSGAEHAASMLHSLSGRTHQVITGLCLQRGAKVIVDQVTTQVTFKILSPTEIKRYADSEEPLDKAGAYAAQGAGAYFIRRIEGSYTNVVGLPMAELCDHLAAFGMRL